MPLRDSPLPFDIVLTPSDTSLIPGNANELGLMLAAPVDEEGNRLPKRWGLEEVPIPTGVRVTDTGVGVFDRPPEMDAAVFRSDHPLKMGKAFIEQGGKEFFSGTCQVIDGKIIKPPANSEITLPTSEGTGMVMGEFGTRLYISDGRYLHASTNGTSFSQVMDAGSGNIITDVQRYGAANGDTGLVVGVENSSNVSQLFWFSTDGTSFTEADAGASREFSFFLVQDETLFGLDQPNTFRSTTNPFTGASSWGSATQVGDEGNLFQGGIVVAAILLIFKEDRTFTVDGSGNVSTLIAQFADVIDAKNFDQFTVAFDSNIYFTADEDVYEYDPVSGEIQRLGVSKLPDTQVDVSTAHTDGVVSGLEGLFALQHTNQTTTGNSIVYITQNEDGKFLFERWLLTTNPTALRPDGPFHYSRLFPSLTNGRHLWFNTTTAGTIGRLDLPRAADPTEDSGSVFQLQDCVYRTGWMSHNFPTQFKDYTEVIVDVRGLSGTTATLDVNYYIDGDLSSSTALQTGISADGLIRIRFPNVPASSFPYTFPINFNDTSASQVSARNILIELVMKSTASGDTPEILSWTVKAAVKFDFRELLVAAVTLADHQKGRGGQVSPHTAKEIRSALRSMRSAQNVAIGYKDYRGYNFDNIRILPGFQEIDNEDEEEGADQTIMSIKMMAVSAEG